MGCPRALGQRSQNSVLVGARALLVVGCRRHVGSTHQFSESITDRVSRYSFISQAAGAIISSILIGRQRATARQGGTEGNHYFVDPVAGAVVVAAATIWAVRACRRRI